MLAYDPIQKILALSTKHGQIKLLGKGNTQALLESDDEQPSKFLQFIPNYGVLFNVTYEDRIEVWNIERKILSHVHKSSEEITSFAVMQQYFFIFVGDYTGNVTVWKLNQESLHIEKMKYYIPYLASHGIINKDAVVFPVRYILPQPTTESKRICLIFADGLMVLWALQESKAMSTTGGSAAQLFSHETKKVTSACWVCPFGSKVAVGYSTGDILFYSIFPNSNTRSGSLKCEGFCNAQIVLASKLNVEYKLEKIPIASFKWVYSDGKANRLYIMGASHATPLNLIQVIHGSERGEPSALLLSPSTPSFKSPRNLDETSNGSQFTLFLTAPLQAFCQLVGLSVSDRDADIYDEAEYIIANAIAKWEVMLCSSTKVDLVWVQVLPDPLLHRIILRFILCRAVLFLFHQAESREPYVPDCLPHLPGFVSPDAEAVESYIFRLAAHLNVSDCFDNA